MSNVFIIGEHDCVSFPCSYSTKSPTKPCGKRKQDELDEEDDDDEVGLILASEVNIQY